MEIDLKELKRKVEYARKSYAPIPLHPNELEALLDRIEELEKELSEWKSIGDAAIPGGLSKPIHDSY